MIFNEDHEGYVKFKQRLIESLLSKAHTFAYPDATKDYGRVLDMLLELNEIHIEGRKSKLVTLCFRAQHLARTRNQFSAEALVQEIERNLTRDDKYLGILLKVSKGIVKIHLNQFEAAISELLMAISRIRALMLEKNVKPRYTSLLLIANYWTGEAYFWKKQYKEALKYCTAIEEQHSKISQTQSRDAFAVLTKNELLLQKIDEKCCKKYQVDKVVKKPVVDHSIGLKLANVEGYRFYNPEAPVKHLDEYWPEDDKQTKKIRALGKSINHNKLSPYTLGKKGSDLPAMMDYRYRPASKEPALKISRPKSGAIEFDDICSRPSTVEGQTRDHAVMMNKLASNLREINSQLCQD